jgi:hypothetical protein
MTPFQLVLAAETQRLAVRSALCVRDEFGSREAKSTDVFLRARALLARPCRLGRGR